MASNYKALGIIIDDIVGKGQKDLKKELRGMLLEMFCLEEGVRYESVRDLPHPLFIRFLNYILDLFSVEFGYFIEGPNESGARQMTLSEYLKLKNK